MSEPVPIIAPIPARPSSLAPPSTNVSRPSSAASSSSRRGKSPNSSQASRSDSRSPRGDGAGSSGDKIKRSGATTTISGGTMLGGSNAAQAKKDKGSKTNGPSPKPDAQANGNRQNGEKTKPTRRGSSHHKARPNAAPTGQRPASQNSGVKSPETDQDAQPKSPIQHLHAAISPPKDALQAAREAAREERERTGVDALSSLQKMISDLKAIPPSSTTSSGGSQPASRSASGAKPAPITVSKPGESSTPVAIPSSATSSKKLKADAPTFTPSFQATSVSPVASQAAISPASVAPQPWPQQNRSASHGSAANRRASSTSQPGQVPAFNDIPMFPNAMSGYSLYPNPLQAHPENDQEELSPMYAQGDLRSQQELYLAQQIQHQHIQLLQAQIAANHIAQQHAQQQQQQQSQMGNFMAPRFQALAAQRAAQQQQQQNQQLLQAQQLYELQQQQLLDYQRRHEEAQAAAVAESVLANPPPVFEEDSPEGKTIPLGPTGRPQLAPTFTFGGKKDRAESHSDRTSMSPPQQPPIINRSEGIGGAAATGLAGLAARAHKRTGSELTPAMQQQLEIQKEIEALQAKQKALMQEDMATQGGSPLSQLNTAMAHKSTPSQTLARHRRVQSGLPSANLNDTFNALSLAEDPQAAVRAPAAISEMPPPPVPTSSGHSRRHSVNVLNKTAGTGSGFGSLSGDIPEDSVISGLPNSTHHRSGSRSGFESGNWRMGSQGGSVGSGPVADLAAAQAQLQSLAQFRAAAGGGHSKMASFSFPNMLPNLLAATTLSTPMGQSLWQQQQAFQTQLQQSSSGPQRKSLFAPYLPQASLPPLLNAGKLVVGFLRVNKKNRSDAYVATDVLEADIYICGSKDRNRALEGDLVAVELLDVDEVWNAKKDKEEKKRKKEENAAYDLKPATAKKLEKKKDDVEVEGQGLTLFDDEEVDDDTKPTYAGHVVAVVERMPGQLFSGQLGVLRPSSAATKEKQEIERREREGDRGRKEETHERPKIVWFKPTDKRVPLIAIPTEQAPDDFVENSDAYVDKLFVATIKRWPITSLHPFGTLVEELGPIGDCEVETSALLKDCNFPTEEFSEAALKCLPPLPWSIPEREFEVRTDLRNERVFTIDPPSAKDLDDALSIKVNDDQTYTVGVHIADVSYFVKANTALDRDARKRATSVYLVQRAVPMLPPQLCEELCSLLPDTERLAFSATFVIDEDANILRSEFARTIIKSCAKLAYSDAKAIIDGSSLGSGKVTSHAPADVEHDVKALYTLASKLKTKRVDEGAMIANKIKVSFKLDENNLPVDCEAHKKTDANVLVEEFMLLANIAVAKQIAGGLPEQALLRRHDHPVERRIDGFVKRAKKLGYTFDPSNAGTLQKSFEEIKDPEAALCLELLKRKAMQRARYFCTGMLDIAKYSHWALNTPVYTHFTSPIRRYADVLVHRMLDACLTSPNPSDVKFLMDRDQVAKCAQQCNIKKQSAKLAEDQSTHLYLCMLIHDLTEKYGPVVREGRVTGVLDRAFDVVVPEFGIEKRVHTDKMPLDNIVFDEHKDVLSLYWKGQDVISYLASTSDDPLLHRLSKSKQSRSHGSADVAGLTEQHTKSANAGKPDFDGLKQSGGHKIQEIGELMKVSVIITSDITKSPPVLVVYACNPYA